MATHEMTGHGDNISANTLFHFTPTLSNLENIIENGIKIGYSIENYESLIKGGQEVGMPMICFCDIPLSRIKYHVSKYGGYAIGLNKSWGIQNKVTPVIYTHGNSPATELLNEIYSNIQSFIEIHDKYKFKPLSKKNKSLLESLMDNYEKIYRESDFEHKKEVNDLVVELKKKISVIFRYVKPYKGKFFRRGAYLEDEIEFYNEKEWRFVPTKKELAAGGLKDSYEIPLIVSPKYKRAIGIKCGKIRLRFSPADIRFLIVKNENEIPVLIDHIDSIKFDKASSKTIQILKTKIISLQQVIDDL